MNQGGVYTLLMYKFFLLLFVLTNQAFAQYSFDFKLNNSIFSYGSDELAGSSMAILCPSIGVLKQINGRNQVGITGEIFFSLSAKSVSLYDIGLVHRYSFSGSSEIVEYASDDIKLSSMNKSNYYFLSSLKRYTYYLGGNKVKETRFEQVGEFFDVDLGLGGAYDIGSETRVFAELSTTVFALAASDDRVKFKGIHLSVGFSRNF